MALKSMPAILYGTAWKDTRTADLVFTAFLQGFRGVDTAAQRKHYREDLVGKGVHQACAQLGLARGDVWLQTKFTPVSGQDTTGYVPYDVHAPVAEQVCASFQASLANLHPEQPIPSVTELVAKYAVTARGNRDKAPAPPPAHQVYIDSYLLHSPMPTLQSTLEAWRVLEALVDTGLVHQIGVSSTFGCPGGETDLQMCTTRRFSRRSSSSRGLSRALCRTGGTPRRVTMCRCCPSFRRKCRPIPSHPRHILTWKRRAA